MDADVLRMACGRFVNELGKILRGNVNNLTKLNVRFISNNMGDTEKVSVQNTKTALCLETEWYKDRKERL